MRKPLILLLAVVAFACEQAPLDTGSTVGSAAFKKGGGGGRPSGVSLEVKIDSDPASAYLLHSDGGPYVDGVGNVIARLGGRSGYFKLDLYESAPRRTYHVHLADGELPPPNDPVCQDPPALDAAGLPVDCWEEGEVGHGDIGFGRLNAFSSPNLLALTPEIPEEKSIGLAAIGMPIGRLTWGKGCDNQNLEADFVDVTAFDDDKDGELDRWTIEAPFHPEDPDGNSVLCRHGRLGKGKQPPAYEVGRFNLPLKLTLLRVSP